MLQAISRVFKFLCERFFGRIFFFWSNEIEEEFVQKIEKKPLNPKNY